MSREPPPIRLEVEVGPTGVGSLRVAGVDIGPAVTRARIVLIAGRIPIVSVELVPSSVVVVVEGRLLVDGIPIRVEP